MDGVSTAMENQALVHEQACNEALMSDRSRELDELLEHGYRFALSLTHDEVRADDLLQDAWFAILRARGPWHRGYLFTAIRSQFVDHCRRNQRAFAEPLDPGSIE